VEHCQIHFQLESDNIFIVSYFTLVVVKLLAELCITYCIFRSYITIYMADVAFRVIIIPADALAAKAARASASMILT